MSLLTVQNIRKHFGPEPVLDGVTFDLHPGERVGLVGPNGCGKTTLLRILSDLETADAGSIQLQPSARLGILQQHVEVQDDRTVWDEAQEAVGYLTKLAQEAEEIAEQMATATDGQQSQQLADRYDHLQQELHRHDAYALEHRIERVLGGLGFKTDTYQQRVADLSGGQQNRLMLARLLLEQPDVMLLDEPSNHLDIEATEWLESRLAEGSETLIVVSHDRYFLDKVTNRTLELLHGTVDTYPGNFSAYRQQKEERLLVQRRTYEKQQEEIAKLEDFVRKHSYGQKHAQAEDRRKKLARIERVDLPREIVAPSMGFPAAERCGDVALKVQELAKSFDRPLFSKLTFEIERGQKWGILGPNGSGKTTLLRCILNQLQPDEGQVTLATGVKIAYFDQQLNGLDESTELLEALRPPGKEFLEQQRRDILARFGLTGDIVHQTVGSLSGGQRNRAVLALLSASDCNFLILDEPTNHLDLWSRDALEKALRKFDGTVLFVSHDRFFVNQVADHLLVVEPDRFRVIEGNYDFYRHLIKQQAAEEAAAAPSSLKKQKAASRKNNDGAKRKRKFRYRKVSDLEEEIFQREFRIEELHALLAAPETLRDGDLVKQYKAEIDQQKQTLASLYEHWEEAVELN